MLNPVDEMLVFAPPLYTVIIAEQVQAIVAAVLFVMLTTSPAAKTEPGTTIVPPDPISTNLPTSPMTRVYGAVFVEPV